MERREFEKGYLADDILILIREKKSKDGKIKKEECIAKCCMKDGHCSQSCVMFGSIKTTNYGTYISAEIPICQGVTLHIKDFSEQ